MSSPGLPPRSRLVPALVLLFAVGLFAAGAVTTSLLRGALLGQVDEQLIQAASTPGLVGRSTDGPGRARRLPGELYLGRLDADGRVVPTAAAGSADAPDLPVLPVSDVVDRQRGPFTVPGQDGGRWRVVAVPLPAEQGSVVIARNLDDVGWTVRRLVLLQAVVGVVVLAAISAAGYAAVRSAVAAPAEVEEPAAQVAPEDR